MGLVGDAALGGLAGAAATGPMTAFMMLTRRAGKTPEIEPRVVQKRLTEAAGVRRTLTESQEKTLAAAGHVAYGAGAGLLYGVMQRFLPLPAVLAGAAFGVGVWAVSYAGWVPVAGILPPPTEEPRETTMRRVTMHVVYGAGMGAAYSGLRRLARR